MSTKLGDEVLLGEDSQFEVGGGCRKARDAVCCLIPCKRFAGEMQR